MHIALVLLDLGTVSDFSSSSTFSSLGASHLLYPKFSRFGAIRLPFRLHALPSMNIKVRILVPLGCLLYNLIEKEANLDVGNERESCC